MYLKITFKDNIVGHDGRKMPKVIYLLVESEKPDGTVIGFRVHPKTGDLMECKYVKDVLHETKHIIMGMVIAKRVEVFEDIKYGTPLTTKTIAQQKKLYEME